MKMCKLVLAAAVVAAASSCPAQTTANPPSAAASSADSKPPQIERRAIDALETMGKYLRTLKVFSIHGVTTTEHVLDSGQKLQFGGTVDYQVRRPDGLHLDINSDREHRIFYYDGKTLTQYAPRVSYYNSVAAPPTLDALATELNSKYGVALPLADVLYWGSDKSGIDDIRVALYIGPARVAGVDCEQYAFRQQGVDWQVWIEDGARPLPRKLVVTKTTDAAMPQYVATLTWNTKAQINEKAFAFVPGKNDRRISLRPTTE